LIPYRVKNPPESYPYVTIGLIVVNTLIYFATSDGIWTIREDIVKQWAVSHNTMFDNPLRLITAMFLHGSVDHLLGNMLFLWIFGAAAEGRLKTIKFILLYLIAGLAGGLLHDGVIGFLHPKQFGLGASGAIMGLSGAYLYMFPFAQIRVFVGWWFRFLFSGNLIADWQAQWVILYFVIFDVLEGFLYKSVNLSDGVAHFAHMGGFGAGFLLMLLLRSRRDTEEASEAQAIRADMGGDYSLLALHDLEALIGREPDNANLVLTFCEKSIRSSTTASYGLARDMFRQKTNLLITQGDPERVARLALTLSSETGSVPLSSILRLASKVETLGEFALAEQCYQRVLQQDPNGRDGEMALARLGRLTELNNPDKSKAAAIYAELLKRFPDSPQATYAHTALGRLGVPAEPFHLDIPSAAPKPAAATPNTPPALTPNMPTMASTPEPQALPPGFAPVSAKPKPENPRQQNEPEPGSAESSGLRPIGS
jgi:membrane associated rhomboid family serine protease